MKTNTKTSDIYFVAAMLSLGSKIESVDKSDPRHMEFFIGLPVSSVYSFESKNLPDGTVVSAGTMTDFDRYERLWANEELIVNAVAYKNALQRMKSIIHST